MGPLCNNGCTVVLTDKDLTTIKNNQVWFSEDGKITQIVCGIYQLPNKNISLKLKIPYPHPALYLPHKQQMYPPEPDRLDGRGEQ